jgi:hypothetical protein
MRWSVFVSLILLTLFGFGLRVHDSRLHESRMAPESVAHAGPAFRPPFIREAFTNHVEWQDKVESHPKVSRDEAEQEALELGQKSLTQWLRSKYPEIAYVPSAKFMHKNIIKSSKPVPYESGAILDQPFCKVEMELELTRDNLEKIKQEDHDMRIEGRLWGLARIVGGLVLLLGAVAGSIRLDEWTKGYLTWPLRIGAMALAAGGAALLWFVV